jgi:excisionase family DNA binding protein
MVNGSIGLATVQEAAELLGVAPKTLRKWIAERRLPTVRLGRAVRIRRIDIARIVDHGLTAFEPARRRRGSE